jgi:site-specific DNA recombinase
VGLVRHRAVGHRDRPPGAAQAMKRAVAYLRVSSKKQAKRDGREEGLSIPAQRDLVVKHVSDKGWTLVDEYVEPGRSGRTADRPALRAMLDRIAAQRDVDVVVMHKFDRFARNAGDHLSIRSALQRYGVTLVSVAEPIEQNAAGKMIEGLLAVLAEHYSDNLSAEVKKGQVQKARMGGFPHLAPLGYLNVRKKVNGVEVAYIDVDEDRARLVTDAFDLYATGEYTLESLTEEMTARGLTSRPRGTRTAMPLTVSGMHDLLINKFHIGVIEWNGIEYRGSHTALVKRATWDRVQQLLTTRAPGGTRERKHHHYLKGTLVCAVCGRNLSIQRSKGQYEYFFCLGQKDRRKPETCREAYVAADRLETAVEAVYERIQLPPDVALSTRHKLEADVVARHAANGDERAFQTRRLVKLEDERRKVMDAYYKGAIDIDLLRSEQERITGEAHEVEGLLESADATLAEWQEVLDGAMTLVTDCAETYRSADPATRRLFNSVVFESIRIAGGKVESFVLRPPFDLFLAAHVQGLPVDEFEYGGLAGERGFEPLIG